MFKKMNLSSPLGIALTVAGVVLAVSPEARRAARRVLVKGTAAVLGAVDHVKNMTPSVSTAAEPAVYTPYSPAAHDITDNPGDAAERAALEMNSVDSHTGKDNEAELH